VITSAIDAFKFCAPYLGDRTQEFLEFFMENFTPRLIDPKFKTDWTNPHLFGEACEKLILHASEDFTDLIINISIKYLWEK